MSDPCRDIRLAGGLLHSQVWTFVGGHAAELRRLDDQCRGTTVVTAHLQLTARAHCRVVDLVLWGCVTCIVNIHSGPAASLGTLVHPLIKKLEKKLHNLTILSGAAPTRYFVIACPP